MNGRPRDLGAEQDDRSVTTTFVSLDAAGTIRFVDEEWLALTGHEPTAVVGDSFVNLLPEDERMAFEATLDAAREGETSACEISIDGSDNTPESMTLKAQPEFGPDDVSRVHCRLEPRGSAADITIGEHLLEVAPVGVFRTTTDGRVLSVNQRLATILGYDTPQEAMAAYEDLGTDLYAVPGRRETFLERLNAEGSVTDFEYETRTAAGQRRWLSMNARLLEETHDGARVIAGFTRDITDRKRRDRQLAVLGRILRHNIRNALTVVQGQAELIRWDRTDAHDAVGTILERTDSLLRQAEKERALTELLRGSTETTERDAVGLVENARTTVRETYPDATITVDGPETATAAVIDGFEQAIVELLDNALRHGDDLEVSVTVRKEPSHVEINIADRGPGIPEVERELLCGDSDETPLFHGTGVGLFLVRQLVARSNGTVSIADNDPRGTVVTIQVPS